MFFLASIEIDDWLNPQANQPIDLPAVLNKYQSCGEYPMFALALSLSRQRFGLFDET